MKPSKEIERFRFYFFIYSYIAYFLLEMKIRDTFVFIEKYTL